MSGDDAGWSGCERRVRAVPAIAATRMTAAPDFWVWGRWLLVLLCFALTWISQGQAAGRLDAICAAVQCEEDDDRDSAKAWTCVAHILSKGGDKVGEHRDDEDLK